MCSDQMHRQGKAEYKIWSGIQPHPFRGGGGGGSSRGWHPPPEKNKSDNKFKVREVREPVDMIKYQSGFVKSYFYETSYYSKSQQTICEY